MLARMPATTGADDESAALVATVLEGDPNDVGALKLRARMAIDADQPEQAIQDMRLALAQAPQDAEIMTLTALAHERAGSRELAGEQLARAVEVSGQAPAESLRYARFLLQDERLDPAEGVVVDALRRAPDDRDLLQLLGQIHLARRDWPRAEQVAAAAAPAGRPRGAGDGGEPRDREPARPGPRRRRRRGARGPRRPGGSAQAMAGLVESYVEAGDPAAAERYLDGVLAEDPASVPARLLMAGLDQLRGDPAAAEAGYRAVLADAPELPQAHQALASFLAGEGRDAEAVAALDAGLAAAPQSGALLFAKAGAASSGRATSRRRSPPTRRSTPGTAPRRSSPTTSRACSPASRDDPESLERAFAIARRLRGSDVPQFQDTYGWILHRRGDRGAGARLPRAGRGGAAGQRAGAVPPRRDRAGARPARRRARQLRPRDRRRRGGQPAAASSRPRAPAHRRDRRGAAAGTGPDADGRRQGLKRVLFGAS